MTAGRDALVAGRWVEARDAFTAVLQIDGTEPEPSEGLSWASWWLGDEATTFSAREQAFRGYRSAGDRCGAARMAIWIAGDFLDFRGEHALATGWLERARRLLDGVPTCAEHGWLQLMRADVVLRMAGDPAEVQRLAAQASQLGRELGVPDLEAVGLGMEGGALVAQGEVAEGMRRLDEASALASAADFDQPFSPGWTLCCMVSACEGVGDVDRAAQWCRAMEAIAEGLGARSMLGVCRSAYGNVLATGGDWPRAEVELLAAVDDLRSTRPAMAAGGVARLGELRARQGRTEEARELFTQAGPHPVALVGLGRLALRTGDPRAAAEAAERVLRRLAPGAVLDRLPALELHARALAALGRFEEAEESAASLEAAARSLGTPYLVGRSHLVRAEVAASRGDQETARRAGEDAVDCLTEGSAPYECALARLVLARSHAAAGRADAAAAEATSAYETFSALGADAELEVARGLLDGGGDGHGDSDGYGDGTRGPRCSLGELTGRELEVLKLVALGLGDAQIAERLVLSPHTVHRHIANIRTKLRLPSRSAAVAYAARAGLL